MSSASGIRALLAYVAEVTMGVTPASPTLKTLRATTRNVNPSIKTLETKEVRPDRNIKDVRHGFQEIGGSVGFELSVQTYDDFLAALLGSTWQSVSITGTP